MIEFPGKVDNGAALAFGRSAFVSPPELYFIDPKPLLQHDSHRIHDSAIGLVPSTSRVPTWLLRLRDGATTLDAAVARSHVGNVRGAPAGADPRNYSN